PQTHLQPTDQIGTTVAPLFGFKLDPDWPGTAELLAQLPEQVATVIFTAGSGLLEACALARQAPRQLFLEVRSGREAAEAAALGFARLVAKGPEGGGVLGR